MADKVFIALQNNADAQPIIAAILADNPHAVATTTPAVHQTAPTMVHSIAQEVGSVLSSGLARLE